MTFSYMKEYWVVSMWITLLAKVINSNEMIIKLQRKDTFIMLHISFDLYSITNTDIVVLKGFVPRSIYKYFNINNIRARPRENQAKC